MKKSSILLILFVGGVVFGCKPPEAIRSDAPSPPKIDVRLETMNWTTFEKMLPKPNPGDFKGTLVDVWATTCVPCRKNFHHTVKLHEKYASQGLRVISLSLDDRNDPKVRETVVQFLTGQRAEFTNILLDEESDVGFEKLNISGIPALFLYDPNGKEIERFTNDDPNNPFTYEQVEQKIAELLTH